MPAVRHRRLLIGLGIFAAVVLAVILLWDWNWFKPLAEARASAALNRKVTIGNLDVKLARRPWILLDEVVVANPPSMPEGTLGSVGRLAIHLDPWPLFKGQVVLPDLILDRLRGDLRPAPDGQGNWVLDTGPAKPAPANGQPARTIDIGNLAIIDGTAHVLDPQHKADFRVKLHTEDAEGKGRSRENRTEQTQIVVEAEGTYADQPVTAKLTGGALLSLRDRSNPYRIDFTAADGATHIHIDGTLLDPLRFGGADVKLELAGDDLAALFPLTAIPLPETPAYKLKGKLDYAERKFRFTDFTGTVGSSDLAGDIVVDPGRERPDVTANLVSQKVLLADLGGFIGAAPGKPGAPTETPKQKAQHRKADAKPNLLPDKPINLPKLRAADMHISYKGERIETQKTPFDNVVAKLDVVDGKLTLKPLSFGVGAGKIVLNVALDGQDEQVHVVADIDFRKVDLGHALQKTTIFSGAGVVGGSGKIDTTGKSMAAMLGRGDGQLKLFMTGGDLSALLIDLAGLDLGNAVLSAIGIPRRADLRCMVADFGLEKGQVKTNTLLIDTTEANVIGTGTINLADEMIDYKLKTEPKHFNIGSIPAPIIVKGPLKSPSIGPEAKTVAARGTAAAVLGVLLTPLAALIPTIQLGLGEDNDCVALLKTVNAPPAPPPPTTGGKGKEGNTK